jgi:outer membrane protein
MVTTEPRELREPGEAALTDPIDQIVSAALARRPDVLTAYAAHEASLAKLRAARAEFMPKIFLSATGSYASNTLDVTTLPGLGQSPPTLNVPGSHFGALAAGTLGTAPQ